MKQLWVFWLDVLIKQKMGMLDVHLQYRTYLCVDSYSNLACSAGVFFERAICSQKRHVETSQREEEMG